MCHCINAEPMLCPKAISGAVGWSARAISDSCPIGRHVFPGGQACLSEALGTGRLAMPAQIDAVDDVALNGQETGETVVSSAVFGDPVGDLHRGPRSDPLGREPVANEDRRLVDPRREGERFWGCHSPGGHVVRQAGGRYAHESSFWSPRGLSGDRVALTREPCANLRRPEGRGQLLRPVGLMRGLAAVRP